MNNTKPMRFSSFGGDVRCIGEWRFENGGFVQILVGGDVDTEAACKMVETMLEVKRAELARIEREKRETAAPPERIG